MIMPVELPCDKRSKVRRLGYAGFRTGMAIQRRTSIVGAREGKTNCAMVYLW